MAQRAFELPLEPLLHRAHQRSCLGEGGRGVVGHLAAFVDGGLDLADQRREVGDPLGQTRELRQLPGERRDLVPGVARGAQEDRDLEDVGGGQDGGA